MNAAATRKKSFSTYSMVGAAMMAALTVTMAMTPIGMIRLPLVSITIAHVPILITALVLGLGEGLIVSFAFGATSLFLAATTPTSILDPYFVNPLVSILPRLLIPFTTYYVAKGLGKLLQNKKGGRAIAAGTAIVVGNLTNTFGVYTMLYLVYARKIFEQTGSSALNLIITAISTTTLVKCVGILIVTLPVVMALGKALKQLPGYRNRVA